MTRSTFACHAILFVVSCQKEARPIPQHTLSDGGISTAIMIHQAEYLYDSTVLYDSLVFFHPPLNRNYRWTVLPDTAGVEFSDDYQHGRAIVSFNQQGAYQIFGSIYDSASGNLVARTDTFRFLVSPDTLFQEIPLAGNDRLAMSGVFFGIASPDTSVLDDIFALYFTSTDDYLAGYQIVTSVNWDTAVSVVVVDSAFLPGFPFYYFNYQQAPAIGGVLIDGLPITRSTRQLSVTWNGQTFTGTLSRPAWDSLVIGWGNSYPISLVHGEAIE